MDFDDDIEMARVEWLKLWRQIEVPVLWLLVVVLLLALTGCKDWLPSNPIPGGLL